jgi:hypothetical protein
MSPPRSRDRPRLKPNSLFPASPASQTPIFFTAPPRPAFGREKITKEKRPAWGGKMVDFLPCQVLDSSSSSPARILEPKGKVIRFPSLGRSIRLPFRQAASSHTGVEGSRPSSFDPMFLYSFSLFLILMFFRPAVG